MLALQQSVAQHKGWLASFREQHQEAEAEWQAEVVRWQAEAEAQQAAAAVYCEKLEREKKELKIGVEEVAVRKQGGAWTVQYDTQGRQYWWQQETGRTQWERPF